MIPHAILYQITQQIKSEILPSFAVMNQVFLRKWLSNSMQLLWPTNCYNNVDFTNQELDTRDNIIFWTNKDEKK